MASTDDRLVYLIFKAQHRLRMYIRDELTAAGVKITLVQAGVLFLLEEGDGRAMSEIGRLLFLDNSTITGVIDRLEKSGFVRRKTNPKDRRSSLIHVTPQGLREADRAEAVIHRVNEDIRADFTPEEVVVFKSILNRFVTKFKRPGACA